MSQRTPRTVTFYLLLAVLAGSGAWGISLIFDTKNSPTVGLEPDLRDQRGIRQTQANQPVDADINASDNSQGQYRESEFSDLIAELSSAQPDEPSSTRPLSDQLELIETLLNESRYDVLSRYINDNYSSFSSHDLSLIRTLYRKRSYELDRKGADGGLVKLHLSEARVFDDLAAWLHLSGSAIKTQQWQTAFDATLQASLQQNDGLELQKLLKRLFRVSGNLRASLEKQGDKLGVHELYDTLYKTHPGHPRFQLELAYSYLRLNRPDDARPLLQQLRFDVELGEVSRDVLARLDQPKTEPVAALSPEPPSSDIEIPLQRRGTNLIANVDINGRTVSLLLDTGASITALDNRLIGRLGLSPTGQVIQLSTANGVRNARLYRTNRLQLGGFRLRNHVVAGIDLGSSGAFSGLLGTDLLNNLSQDYSFLIDNEKSALIFRPK